jgi:hypothetical protein
MPKPGLGWSAIEHFNVHKLGISAGKTGWHFIAAGMLEDIKIQTLGAAAVADKGLAAPTWNLFPPFPNQVNQGETQMGCWMVQQAWHSWN